MDVQVGDRLLLKKPHPCGNSEFAVLRVGMDFKIRCQGCGREVMVPRAKVEKNIRRVEREGRQLDRQELDRRPAPKKPDPEGERHV